MPDRDRVIRLKVQADSTRARAELAALRAEQQKNSDSILANEAKVRTAENARSQRQADYNRDINRQRTLLGQLRVEIENKIKSSRLDSEAEIQSNRAAAAAGELRNIQARKDQQNAEHLLKSHRDQKSAVDDLIRSTSQLGVLTEQQSKSRDSVVNIKAELDDHEYRAGLERITRGNKPKVTMEAVLEERKVKEKIKLLEARKIELKADIDTAKIRVKLAAALASAGHSGKGADVGAAKSALSGLEGALGDTLGKLDELTPSLGKAGGAAGSFGEQFAQLGKFAGPAIGALVAAILPLIGELLAAGAAAAAMVGTFAGAAIVVGVGLVAAFKGALGAVQAYTAAQQEQEAAATANLTGMQKYERQLNKLTPAGRNFANVLTKQVLPAFQNLQGVAETSFLPGITEGFSKLLTLTPQFTSLISSAGKAVGDAAAKLGTFFTSGDGAGEFAKLFEGIRDTVNNLAPAFEQLGEALGTIFGEGAGSAATFTDKINQVATSFNRWIQGIAGNGELQAFFKKGEQYLEDFLGLIGDVGDLIGEAFGAFTTGEGPTFIGMIRQMIQFITKTIDSFNDFGVVMDGLKAIGVIVFGTIFLLIEGIIGIVGLVAAAIGGLIKLWKKELELAIDAYNAVAKRLHLHQIDTSFLKDSNAEHEKTNALLEKQVSIGAGLTEKQSDYLKDVQEGGKLWEQQGNAATTAAQQIDAVAQSHADAMKAAKDYTDQVNKLHDSVVSASRAERDANEALSKTYRDDRRALVEDRKQIAEDKKDVEKTKAAGIRSVADAENRVAAAQRASKKAQEGVNLARKEALRDLVALRQEVQQGYLDEEKGALALRRAQEKYYALLKDPTASANDKEEARLDVQQKLQDNRGTQTKNKNNQADLNDAEKKGVEGSDKVKDAIQARIDATKAEKDAVADLKLARTAAADANKKAIDDERKAERKYADDKKQFAIDERDAREKQQDAHKAYMTALQDEVKQLAILEAKKKEAFDDEALKKDAFKKTLMSQDFAGYGANGANKTLSNKDAEEYIKLYNGLDVGLRNSLKTVGLPNSLEGMRTMVTEINKAKKANPKSSASDIVNKALDSGFSVKNNSRLLYDPKTKRYSENADNPQGQYSSPSAGSTSSQSLAPGYSYGKDGKVHKDPLTPLKPVTNFIGPVFNASSKDLDKSGKDSGTAFVTGLNAGVKNSTGTLKTTLKTNITDPGSKDSTVGIFKSDLGINSPSTVFKEFGGAMGAGLNDGLLQSVATIKGTISNYYTGNGRDSLITQFRATIGEPQGKNIAGALGVGFNSGLLNSVATIMGSLNKYYSGTGKESVIGKMMAGYNIDKSGFSKVFFAISGAIWTGFAKGIDNSVATVMKSVNAMMKAIFNGVLPVADQVGDIFSPMMVEANYNLTNGVITILNTLKAFTVEVNKVTADYGIVLGGDSIVIPSGAPNGVYPKAKAKGGFAGAGDQGDYQRYDSGGMVRGSGGGTEDKEIIRISPREFIQPEHSVNYYGADVMEGLRTRRIPREAVAGYAQGGSPINVTYKDGLRAYASGGFPAIDALIAVMDKAPKSFKVDGESNRFTNNSGYRGKPHGGSTNHGLNRAVDFNSSRGPAGEHDIANWLLKNYGKHLRELIHTDSGNDSKTWKGQYVKEGKVVPASYYAKVANDHKNHVHVAITNANDLGTTGGYDPGTSGGVTGGNKDTAAAKKKLTAITFASIGKKFGDIGAAYSTYLRQMLKDGYDKGLVKKLMTAISNRLDNDATLGQQPDERDFTPDNGLLTGVAPKAKGINNAMREAYLRAKDMGASKKQVLALFEAGLAESHFKNYANKKVASSLKLPHDGQPKSDGTSVGILQQQVGADGSGKKFRWGNVKEAMNPSHAAFAFLKAAKEKNQSGKASTLAQRVQVSAFKDGSNYAAQRPEAINILKALGYKESEFRGFAEGGMAQPFVMNGFATGGQAQAGMVAPNRNLSTTAARITGAGGGDKGSRFNVENLNITNPQPERAGDSIYRRVETLKSIYG